MTAKIQVELFGIVLDSIDVTELVNEVFEINLEEVGSGYELVRYAFPK